MYLMYVDESGDTGLVNSPARFFALSGLVVHESRWRDFINRLINFKKSMRAIHGLPVRAEIHASEFIKSQVYGLPRHIRLAILRNFIDELAQIPDIAITNIIVDKRGEQPGFDVFDFAWKTLFQRFENTLKHGNFPGNHRHDFGIAITDATSGKKLLRMVRRMAVHNYVPHLPRYGGGARNMPIVRLIEDPHGKNSAETLPIQACDVSAYFLVQRYAPNSYVRRSHARFYFDRLRPVLNTRASNNNRLGIVEL